MTDPETTTDGTPAAVTLDISEAVATIRIDDGKANALSHVVLAGIGEALDRVEDSDAAALVVLGRPGKFSAGFDLSVMTAGPQQASDLLGRGAELGLRLYEFPIPVVFGITGHALAMGGIILCCADVRVGIDGPYKIGLPEVRIGMPVPSFAVELCRDRLSPRWFTRAVQLAHSHSPAEALEAGFFDELVDADTLEQRVLEIAADLAENVHPAPFRLTRSTVRGGLATRLRNALAEDLAAFDVS